MTAPFGRRRCLTATCRAVGAYTMLGVIDNADPAAPEPLPGQFYMLSAQTAWGAGVDERPFLPRAFSAMGANDGQLWFMLEDVGPGTHRLCSLRKGDGVWVTGPFGHGFRAPPAEHLRPLLVAGGIGLPPIVAWSRALADGDPPAQDASLLLGFRDHRHASIAQSFAASAQIATDDGSVGHHGFVTDLLSAELDEDADRVVYACGPPGMLESVREICVQRGVPAQLALEAGMACGFGACYGCVTPMRDGLWSRVCVDGPVFDAALLAEVEVH